MRKSVKWGLRIVALLIVTFILMLSGFFDPLAESMKVTITNWLNVFPSVDPLPYPDRLENSYFTMYVAFNALAGAFVVTAAEWLFRRS